MEKISITTEYIKLDQFLKLANLVSSGGEARFFIEEQEILVNGENEKRRGKKLREGDLVELKGQTFMIVQNG